MLAPLFTRLLLLTTIVLDLTRDVVLLPHATDFSISLLFPCFAVALILPLLLRLPAFT